MSYSKSNLGSDSIHLTDRLCIDSSKEKPASEVGLQTTELAVFKLGSNQR